MTYKDYYKPSILDDAPQIKLLHLLNKYEGFVGLVEVHMSNGVVRYHGVREREVIIKIIEYRNQPPTKAYWYYIKDIKSRVTNAEALLQPEGNF